MALRVIDYSSEIASGRLILCVGPDAWNDLSAFLRVNEGYVAPDRVMNWPWFTPAETASISERLGRIATQIETERAERIRKYAAQPAARDVRVAIVSPDGIGPGAA